MARPSYPSDERRRKTPQHIRAYVSLRNHPRYGLALADPETRGIISGLWIVAGQSFAGKTGDVVTLTSGDLTWITGRENRRAALIVLSRACQKLDYRLHFHLRGERSPGWRALLEDMERRWAEAAVDLQRPCTDPAPELDRGCTEAGAGLYSVPTGAVAASVWVRNFAKRQGYDSALRNGAPRTPHPSEVRGPRTEDREENSAEAAESAAAEEPPLKPKKKATKVEESKEKAAELWVECVAAAKPHREWRLLRALYDKHAPARLRDPAMRDLEPRDVLVGAVRGYLTLYSNGSWADWLDYLQPDTIFRPTKHPKYVSAWIQQKRDQELAEEEARVAREREPLYSGTDPLPGGDPMQEM